MGNGRGSLMNAMDQIVNAPRKIDDLSFSLQLKLGPFSGGTEFPLMSVACTLALTQNRASHLWMLEG